MITIKIADLNVQIDNRFHYIERQCRAYQSDEAPDFTVAAAPDELEQERQFGSFNDGYLESICVYRAIARRLPEYDAAVFHAAVVELDGRAFAFTAPSGTGKTTHIRLWQERFGEQMRILNGDKPILRLLDGVIYAYGTPWRGKENYGCNGRARLDGICRLERGEQNRIVPLAPSALPETLLHQMYLPKDSRAVDRTLSLIEQIALRVPAFSLQCNMKPEAAELSSRTLLSERQK